MELLIVGSRNRTRYAQVRLPRHILAVFRALWWEVNLRWQARIHPTTAGHRQDRPDTTGTLDCLSAPSLQSDRRWLRSSGEVDAVVSQPVNGAVQRGGAANHSV